MTINDPPLCSQEHAGLEDKLYDHSTDSWPYIQDSGEDIQNHEVVKTLNSRFRVHAGGPLSSWVTLGTLPNLYEFQFPHLETKDKWGPASQSHWEGKMHAWFGARTHAHPSVMLIL